MIEPERLLYGDDPSQFIDRYQPNTEPLGTIISIHGGYWRATYGLDLNAPLSLHLAHSGWTVINIEYRRIAPAQTTVEESCSGSDQRARARVGVWDDMSSDVWTACGLATNGTRPIVAVGHSAGGQLALWAAAQHDLTIDAVIALAPITDLIACDELELSNGAAASLFGGSSAELPDAYRSASPRHLLPLGVPQMLVHGTGDEDVPHSFAIGYIRDALRAHDDVSLVDPADISHLDLIDPTHDVWRTIDAQLDLWVSEL